jgi:hypothetical protein
MAPALLGTILDAETGLSGKPSNAERASQSDFKKRRFEDESTNYRD